MEIIFLTKSETCFDFDPYRERRSECLRGINEAKYSDF